MLSGNNPVKDNFYNLSLTGSQNHDLFNNGIDRKYIALPFIAQSIPNHQWKVWTDD
jgi:hypothetical protein